MSLTLIPYTEQTLDFQRWDEFVKTSPQGMLYQLSGYASIIAPGWQALVAQQGEKWLAVMPFIASKKWRFRAAMQPLFAQYWGILYAPNLPQHTYKYFSQKRRIADLFASYFEEFHLVSMNLAPEEDYLLPFHWHKFELRTRYTYRLSLLAEEYLLLKQAAPPLVRQLKKAERNGLKIATDDSASPLLMLMEQQHAQGNNLLGVDFAYIETFKRLAQWLLDQRYARLLYCEHPERHILAAGLFAQFGNTSLYLSGAYAPTGSDSGAMSWLLWRAILSAKIAGMHYFDFEGSMIEPIERFFRKFGAYPVPYHQLYKNQLPLPIKWIREYMS